jgi:hypothetical protein
MDCKHCRRETSLSANGPYIEYYWGEPGNETWGPGRGVHPCCEVCGEERIGTRKNSAKRCKRSK